MNSSYVETQEEQRQWLSFLASNHTLDRADPIVDLSPTEADHPKYGINANSGDLGSFGYSGYEAQYQQQPVVAWGSNNFRYEPAGLHVGIADFANSPPTWSLPYGDGHSFIASSALHNQGGIPPQSSSTQPLHTTRPMGYVDCNFFPQEAITQPPFISLDAEVVLSGVDLMTSPNIMEAKRTDPPLFPSSDGTMPRQQSPRFLGDEYAASWVRGSGVERTGWCGFCPTWHRLKDSAYVTMVCSKPSRASQFPRRLLTCILDFQVLVSCL